MNKKLNVYPLTSRAQDTSNNVSNPVVKYHRTSADSRISGEQEDIKQEQRVITGDQ